MVFFSQPWSTDLSVHEKLGFVFVYFVFNGISVSLPSLAGYFLQVIAAEGEQKASRALKEAADVMNESPSAIQLRYLQTLNTISAEKNSTIIFPLPIDFLKGFLDKK